MRNWILYFLAVAISVVSVPFAAEKTVKTEIPALTLFSNGEITEISIEDFALRLLLEQEEHCKQAEALKALAVSARSIGAYLSVFGCKHSDFDICDDKNCCFALSDPLNADEKALERCKTALSETYGFILTSDALPAMALFTLCSGSGTWDCEEFSYLVNVAETERCPLHITEQIHSYADLAELMPEGTEIDDIKNDSVIIYENQKCAFGVLCGKYTETQNLISALGLKSPEFTIEFGENNIESISYGIGHGYGMSICGANKMAESQKQYTEILENYYPELILNKLYHN